MSLPVGGYLAEKVPQSPCLEAGDDARRPTNEARNRIDAPSRPRGIGEHRLAPPAFPEEDAKRRQVA